MSLIVSLRRQRIPRIDKSCLLRLPCSKPIVMVKMSSRLIYTRPYNISFHTHDEVRLSTWKRTFLQRCKSIWQRLGYMYKGRCFLVGCTTEFLVADVLPDIVDSLPNHSEILVFAWQNCHKPRLELTSRLANAYKVTRSDLGATLLRNIRPSSWSFVRFSFAHPKALYEIASKSFSAICPSW